MGLQKENLVTKASFDQWFTLFFLLIPDLAICVENGRTISNCKFLNGYFKGWYLLN